MKTPLNSCDASGVFSSTAMRASDGRDGFIHAEDCIAQREEEGEGEGEGKQLEESTRQSENRKMNN